MTDERVGTAQRNHVLELLGRALAEGYLALDEYDERIVAASGARVRSELMAPLHDLPAQFQWDPRMLTGRAPARQPEATTEANVRTLATLALVLGIMSLPLSFCLVGWIFGGAAVIVSFPGSRRPGTRSQAVVGRVLGLMGILLSLCVITIGVLDTAR